MPIGIIVNGIAVIIGGLIGTYVGPKLSERLKANLNMIMGLCAMTMGISSVVQMVNMPPLFLRSFLVR